MTKIALISPQGDLFSKNIRMQNFLKNSDVMNSFKLLWGGPNLGLLTIAAFFPDDWVCDYIDENFKQVDFNIKYDIVFISSMTQPIMNAYSISKKFMEKGILTVLGGIHPSLLINEAIQNANVVITGEGEKSMKKFIEDYYNGSLQKIYNGINGNIFDIKLSPLPKFELLKGYDYPLITLQTTRGCPFSCFFCAASKVFGTKYRRKNNQQIFAELEQITSLFPDKLVLFADDNMFVKRKESKELLIQLADFNIRWIAQSDISIAEDDELLELLVKAGCQWIVIGFESVSKESLDGIDRVNWKYKKYPSYQKHINKIQSYGIGIYGTFIVGLDNDGPNIFLDTADFIISNKLYGANITVPTPLPSTELRRQMKNENRILNRDWSYYTLWDVTLQPKNFTIDELEEGLMEVYINISQEGYVKDRMKYMHSILKKRRKYRLH